MDKINFQNGTQVSPAKITIDGTDYIVTPAEYEGSTPISAYVLNKLQENIENAINENTTEIEKLQGVVLYEGEATTNTIELSEKGLNFKYIEIFFVPTSFDTGNSSLKINIKNDLGRFCLSSIFYHPSSQFMNIFMTYCRYKWEKPISIFSSK